MKNKFFAKLLTTKDLQNRTYALEEIISDFRDVLEIYAEKEHEYINRFASNILKKHPKTFDEIYDKADKELEKLNLKS